MRVFILAFIIALSVGCNKPADCEKPKACTEIPQAGPCEALIPKYYYDAKTKTCRQFEWGGCDGNVPFNTLEECWECECDKRLE